MATAVACRQNDGTRACGQARGEAARPEGRRPAPAPAVSLLRGAGWEAGRGGQRPAPPLRGEGAAERRAPSFK